MTNETKLLDRLDKTTDKRIEIAEFEGIVTGVIKVHLELSGDQPYLGFTLVTQKFGELSSMIKLTEDQSLTELALLSQDEIISLEGDLLYDIVKLTRDLAGDNDGVKMNIKTPIGEIRVEDKRVLYIQNDVVTCDLPTRVITASPKMFARYLSIPGERLREVYATLLDIYTVVLGPYVKDDVRQDLSEVYLSARPFMGSDDEVMTIVAENNIHGKIDIVFYSDLENELFMLEDGNESVKLRPHLYPLLDERSKFALRICFELSKKFKDNTYRAIDVIVK